MWLEISSPNGIEQKSWVVGLGVFDYVNCLHNESHFWRSAVGQMKMKLQMSWIEEGRLLISAEQRSVFRRRFIYTQGWWLARFLFGQGGKVARELNKDDFPIIRKI